MIRGYCHLLRPSHARQPCVKLRFDPHCLPSWWHWCSSCEQRADLMPLHNAERGSDRLHKPVIGSCSHLSRLLLLQGALTLGEPLHHHHCHLLQSYPTACSGGHAAPGNQVGKQVSKALDGSWKSTPEAFVIDGWMEFITFVAFSVTVGMRLHNGALSVWLCFDQIPYISVF